jgi:hypothetical protein
MLYLLGCHCILLSPKISSTLQENAQLDSSIHEAKILNISPQNYVEAV